MHRAETAAAVGSDTTMAKVSVAAGAFDQASGGERLPPPQFVVPNMPPALTRSSMPPSANFGDVTVKGAAWAKARPDREAAPAETIAATRRSDAQASNLFSCRSLLPELHRANGC